MISAIPHTKIDQIWPKVAPLLERAIDKGNGECDIDDLHSYLENNSHMLIIAHEGEELQAALTLNMIEYPAKRILNISYSSGELMSEWLDDFMDVAVMIAKEHQADSIYIQGRDGWIPTMRPHGFNKAYTVLERLI